MAALYQGLWGIGNGIFNGMAFAMLPDITDYTEWKKGISLPGTITSIVNFSLKLGGALATFLAGQILVYGQYDVNLPVQSNFTQTIIRLSIPVFSGICIALAMILTWSLKGLSKKDLEYYQSYKNENF